MRFVTFVHFLLVCMSNHIWAESENFLYSLVKLLLMSIKAKFAWLWDLVFSRITYSRYDDFSRGRRLLTRDQNHTNFSRGIQTIQSFLNIITQPPTSHEVAQSDHTPHEGPKPYHLNVSRVSKPYHLNGSRVSKPYHVDISRVIKTIPS